jgi:hypothetical protein
LQIERALGNMAQPQTPPVPSTEHTYHAGVSLNRE